MRLWQLNIVLVAACLGVGWLANNWPKLLYDDPSGCVVQHYQVRRNLDECTATYERSLNEKAALKAASKG